jgi:hypothetical protein
MCDHSAASVAANVTIWFPLTAKVPSVAANATICFLLTAKVPDVTAETPRNLGKCFFRTDETPRNPG